MEPLDSHCRENAIANGADWLWRRLQAACFLASMVVYHDHMSMWAGTRQLWKLMLGTESEVTSDFYKVRKYWDINVGQWTAKGANLAVVPFRPVVTCFMPSL